MDDLLLVPTPADVEALLGRRVRAARRARGWTQAELAERSALSVATVARFEASGQGQISTLLQICGALGRLQELTGLLEEAPPATLDALRRQLLAARP